MKSRLGLPKYLLHFGALLTSKTASATEVIGTVPKCEFAQENCYCPEGYTLSRGGFLCVGFSPDAKGANYHTALGSRPFVLLTSQELASQGAGSYPTFTFLNKQNASHSTSPYSPPRSSSIAAKQVTLGSTLYARSPETPGTYVAAAEEPATLGGQINEISLAGVLSNAVSFTAAMQPLIGAAIGPLYSAAVSAAQQAPDRKALRSDRDDRWAERRPEKTDKKGAPAAQFSVTDSKFKNSMRNNASLVAPIKHERESVDMTAPTDFDVVLSTAQLQRLLGRKVTPDTFSHDGGVLSATLNARTRGNREEKPLRTLANQSFDLSDFNSNQSRIHLRAKNLRPSLGSVPTKYEKLHQSEHKASEVNMRKFGITEPPVMDEAVSSLEGDIIVESRAPTKRPQKHRTAAPRNEEHIDLADPSFPADAHESRTKARANSRTKTPSSPQDLQSHRRDRIVSKFTQPSHKLGTPDEASPKIFSEVKPDLEPYVFVV